MIGVCFGTPEEEENYGALLLAVPGDKIYDSTAESIDDVMSSLAVGGLTAFSADPESHLVLHASDPSLVGKNILDLGLPETALSSGCQDFFNIDQKPYYVECEELDSAFYFYAADQANLYKGIGMQAVYTSAAAAVLFAILAVFLLIGYGKFFAVWSDVGEELKDEDDEVLISGIRRKYSLDPSKRWRPDAIVHGIHSPFRTASFVVAVLLVTAILFLGTRLIFSGSGSGDSLIVYIIRGNWTKGVNLFAFTSILIRLCEVLIAVVLIKLLLHLVSSALGTKGETICRLLTNLTSYCGVLFFVYFALYDLGFQPNTLLASLGLLSFAVSLGAKDLITDVIAGLSIVFEGEYQVGDIIDVGGYRGEVLEIGVRTTKLKGSGGNIKIISNRDIKNVINMTRLNSWCPLDVSVSSDQPLNTIEDLLRAQLPVIGKSIPEIVSGPFYKGVTAMGRGTVTLSIVAECNEGDYFTIQRNLNRAVQELFEQNGIKIM